MGELTELIKIANGMGIAAVPFLIALWWFERKDRLETGRSNTAALTTMAVTVNAMFQLMLAKKGGR